MRLLLRGACLKEYLIHMLDDLSGLYLSKVVAYLFFFLSATKIKEIKKETSSKVPFFRHSFTQTNNCSPIYLPVHSPSGRNHHPTIRFTDFVR